MSLGFGALHRRLALARAGLGPGMRVLDVATGTGLTARAAARIVGPSGQVVGVDPSAGMLRHAGQTGAVRLVQGLGEQLPFGAERFDLVSMGYALRHLPDLEAGFAEYGRVLRPGGRVLILEISRPGGRRAYAASRWLLGRLLPRVTRVITRSRDAERLTRYYWETVAECAPAAVIVRALDRAGFDSVTHRAYGGVLSEYAGVKPGR
jgi:demethylmenaquinone methyltransferase/2-methoxy-6-polyprenyl-1,4-benzoquinol methylase